MGLSFMDGALLDEVVNNLQRNPIAMYISYFTTDVLVLDGGDRGDGDGEGQKVWAIYIYIENIVKMSTYLAI